jgi:hypothetical protein
MIDTSIDEDVFERKKYLPHKKLQTLPPFAVQ